MFCLQHRKCTIEKGLEFLYLCSSFKLRLGHAAESKVFGTSPVARRKVHYSVLLKSGCVMAAASRTIACSTIGSETKIFRSPPNVQGVLEVTSAKALG